MCYCRDQNLQSLSHVGRISQPRQPVDVDAWGSCISSGYYSLCWSIRGTENEFGTCQSLSFIMISRSGKPRHQETELRSPVDRMYFYCSGLNLSTYQTENELSLCQIYRLFWSWVCVCILQFSTLPLYIGKTSADFVNLASFSKRSSFNSEINIIWWCIENDLRRNIYILLTTSWI